MTGFTTLTVPYCPSGTTIYLQVGAKGSSCTVRCSPLLVRQCGELVHQDGTVWDTYSNSKMQANYTCSGNPEGETYTVLFSYMGFRHVQARLVLGRNTSQTITLPIQLTCLVQITGYPGVPDTST